MTTYIITGTIGPFPVQLSVETATPLPTPTPTPTPTPAPNTPSIAFGLHADGAAWDMTNITAIATKLAKQPAIVNTFMSWIDQIPYPGINTNPLDNCTKADATPMISWAPQDYHQPLTSPAYPLQAIVDGRFDGFLTSQAQGYAAYGKPVLLRFAWEMNGNWLPWGANINGNTPAQYIVMWQHVVDLFRRYGAGGNVRWVWCPNITVGSAAPFEAWYPGDAHVDYVALDGYCSTPRGWRTFGNLFGPDYARLQALAPSKPVLIGELGCDEDARKAAWLTDAFGPALAAFPQIRALCYYHLDRTAAEGAGSNWLLDSSAGALAAAKAALADPRFVSTLG